MRLTFEQNPHLIIRGRDYAGGSERENGEMKCPKCGFFVSDRLDACKKCGRDLTAEKVKLGLGFLSLGVSRFERQGGSALGSTACAASPALEQESAPTEAFIADSDSDFRSFDLEEGSGKPPAVSMDSGLDGGTEDMENPEEFFDVDFGADVEALEEKFVQPPPVNVEHAPEETYQFLADEEEFPTIENAECTSVADEQDHEDFDFPDMHEIAVNSASSEEHAMPPLDPINLEPVVREKLSKDGETGSASGADMPCDMPPIPDMDTLDEDELALTGDESLVLGVEERRASGTLMLDPDEIEAMLQTEIQPETGMEGLSREPHE